VHSGDRRLAAQARLRPLLYPLAWAYGGVQALRRGAYRIGLLRSRRVDISVVSIGSLLAGGSGKTPFAAYVAEMCGEKRVAILSRGYGGRYADSVRVEVDSDPVQCGDEPVLLARGGSADVWVGKDRAALALRLASDYEIFILDDGYQHLGLYRDLNVCLVPAGPPEPILPAGLMREGRRALRDADFVVAVDARPEWLEKYYRGASGIIRLSPGPWQSKYGPFSPPEKVLAFGGVARPERFLASLSRFQLTDHVLFADHHLFTAPELDALWRRAQETGAEALVTTAKDAVRIERPPDSLPLYWRDVTVDWQAGREEFERLLAKVLSGKTDV